MSTAGFVTSREQRRQLGRDNAKLPKQLTLVPREDWPAHLIGRDDTPLGVWRSRNFMVQKYDAPEPAIVRLSVHRTTLSGDRWADGITWDELQAIKNELGFFAATAVEVYPPILDTVNVANMRHLWVLAKTPDYVWSTGRRAST